MVTVWDVSRTLAQCVCAFERLAVCVHALVCMHAHVHQRECPSGHGISHTMCVHVNMAQVTCSRGVLGHWTSVKDQ